MKRKYKGYQHNPIPKPYISLTTRKRRKKKFLIGVSSVISIVAIVIFLVFLFSMSKESFDNPQEILVSTDELLDSSNYEELFNRSSDELAKEPSSMYWLKLRGLSAYQNAVKLLNEKSEDSELINIYLDQAIISLKKMLILDNESEREMIEILLGKAYYVKGRFFMDSSIFHFKNALSLIGSTETSFDKYQIQPNLRIISYYLGSAYAEIGDFENSIDYFSQIEGEDKSQLHIAVSYYNMKNYLKAYEQLEDIIISTTDSNLKNSCLNWKAKIYFEEGKYDKSIEIYEKLADEFPNSPDPLYQIGLTYYKMNNKVKARAFFRKATTKEIPCPLANEALMTFF